MANSEERNSAYTSAGGSSHQDDIRNHGREAADEIKDAAHEKAEGVFDQQKGSVADQAKGLSSAFRKMAQELDDQDQGYLSGYANRMASYTDTASERLRDQDMDGLAGQVRDYSRQQPAVFMGGAVVLGFVLARFMNSSQKRDEGRTSQSRTGTILGDVPGNASGDVSVTAGSASSSERADKGFY